MYHKLRSILFALFLGVSAAFGQGYKIEATITGLRDSTCYLAHYTGLGASQFLIKDTAQVSASGQLVFEGKTTLPEGLYVISIAKWRLFDVVVDTDQFFSLTTDTASVRAGNPPLKMKVVGSKENELFYGFNAQMRGLVDEYRVIQTEGKNTQNMMTNVKLRNLRRQMSDTRNAFIAENKSTLTSKLLSAASEPDVPEPPTLPNGKIDSTFQYRYYKKHYFDGVDFTDERLLRSPFIQQKIDNYFENLVYQVPDSVKREADEIMARTKGRDLRRFVAYRMASRYEQSKMLGMEDAFVHIGEKYYVNEPNLWDSSTVSTFKKRVAVLKPLLVGKKIPNMFQTDTLGNNKHLYDVKAKYTVVFIYADDCGHCKDSAPKVKAFYDKYKNLGVKIYASNLHRYKPDWMKFIQTYKIQEFINVIDIHKDPSTGATVYYTDYDKTFDAITTPTIYVLDENKNIIARKVPAEELDRYFEFMLKRRGK